MIERILKHMNIYKEMKNAAIPLKLIVGYINIRICR